MIQKPWWWYAMSAHFMCIWVTFPHSSTLISCCLLRSCHLFRDIDYWIHASFTSWLLCTIYFYHTAVLHLSQAWTFFSPFFMVLLNVLFIPKCPSVHICKCSQRIPSNGQQKVDKIHALCHLYSDCWTTDFIFYCLRKWLSSLYSLTTLFYEISILVEQFTQLSIWLSFFFFTVQLCCRIFIKLCTDVDLGCVFLFAICLIFAQPGSTNSVSMQQEICDAKGGI